MAEGDAGALLELLEDVARQVREIRREMVTKNDVGELLTKGDLASFRQEVLAELATVHRLLSEYRADVSRHITPVRES